MITVHRTINTLLLLAILLCIAYVTLFSQRQRTIGPQATVIFHHYDSSIHFIYNTPKIILVDSISYPGRSQVDTQAVLARYFNSYVYSQTFRDSNIEARIIDTLRENKILGSAFQYKILRPATTEVRKEENKLAKFSAGVFISVHPGKTGLGPQLSYRNNKGAVAAAGYDVAGKGLLFSYSIPISFTRK